MSYDHITIQDLYNEIHYTIMTGNQILNNPKYYQKFILDNDFLNSLYTQQGITINVVIIQKENHDVEISATLFQQEFPSIDYYYDDNLDILKVDQSYEDLMSIFTSLST